MLKKIFLLLVILAFNCCSKNDDSNNRVNNLNRTIVITSGQVSHVEANSVSFNTIRNDLQVGNIIVSGVAENAPMGFLRRIVSIISHETYTVVTTENSNIKDASNGLFTGTQSYSAEDISDFQNYDPNSIISIAHNSLNGTLKVKPSYRFNIAMEYTPNGYTFSDISFLPKSENDLDVSMAVQTTAEIAQTYSEVKSIIEGPKTIYLGALPIVVNTSVAYEISNHCQSGHGYVNKHLTYKNRSLINAGFIYSPVAARIPDSGITILEDNSTTNYIPTLFESPRQPSISLKSNFNVSLYDFTEAISVEAKSSLGFDISSSDNNNNTLTTVRNVISSGAADGAFFSRFFTSGHYSDGNYLVFHSPLWVVLSSTSSTSPVNPVNPDPVVSCTLVSEGYQYNTSSYNGICYTNENWRTIYSDGIIYNGQIEYGAYIRHIPPYTELPSGWRVPNPIDYRNLINSLGNNAFAVLTDPNGFNAKPYGYIRKNDGPVAQPNLEDFNNKAYFATTDDGTIVMCLVVDFTTQTVYMKYLPSRTYLGGFGSFYVNYYYPIRLMKG